jgi:glycosyltransferase involved in cell wall biosynthesis
MVGLKNYKMKLSVIIVTYMFEDYIEQCLISALGQKTNFDYEILVRDDFSSDNSLNHIKRIAELNNKVKVFESDKNLGPTKNFEFLYSKANGEYIVILDGDDYWDNMDLLQKSVDYLDDNLDTSMVFCGHRQKFVNDNNRIDPPEITKWLGLLLNNQNHVTTENLLEKNYVGFGKVFRKIENLFEPWMYELPYIDWGINVRLSYYGKIKYLDFPGGVYRVHNRGIFSAENEEKRKYNTLKSKEIIKINYKNKI